MAIKKFPQNLSRFYVKEDLKFMKIANEGNEFQSCWIEIINDINPNVIAGVFYRHSRKNFGMSLWKI